MLQKEKEWRGVRRDEFGEFSDAYLDIEVVGVTEDGPYCLCLSLHVYFLDFSSLNEFLLRANRLAGLIVLSQRSRERSSRSL